MSIKNTLMRALIATVALLVGTQAFAARTTTYYHNDGLGSVVAATNEAGAVLWRKDYAPFGEQIDTTPDTERQSYTGKSHDDVTGLTYFGGRYYDPQAARFMSIDPIAFVEDNTMSFNRYLYVNNNPYKYVDPDGEFLNFAAKFILDVGLNLAINYATSGSLGIGMALKDSALGVVNPAKTLAKMKTLANVLAKTNKKKVDYASIKNPADVGPGKDFTLRQKQEALELNKAANGGVVKSDKSGTTLARPQKSKRGETPDPNEWQFDHKIPKNCGGTNCSSNIQILSRKENRLKSDN
jgi:RHS repeat-associated protein